MILWFKNQTTYDEGMHVLWFCATVYKKFHLFIGMKSLIEVFLKEQAALNWKYLPHFQVQRFEKPSVSLKEANRKNIITVMEKVTQGDGNALVKLNYVED